MITLRRRVREFRQDSGRVDLQPGSIGITDVDPDFAFMWQGIIGLWPLFANASDGGNGQIFDLGPNNYSGQLLPSPYARDKAGWRQDQVTTGDQQWLIPGFRFNNATLDDYRIDLRGNPDHPGGKELTVMALCNYADTDDGRIISKASGSAAASHWIMMGETGTDGFRVRLKTGGETTTHIATSALTPASINPLLVGFSYDGVRLKMYVDAELVLDVAKTGDVDVDSSVPMSIGNQPQGNVGWAGHIWWIGMYNWAFPQSLWRLVNDDRFGWARRRQRRRPSAVALTLDVQTISGGSVLDPGLLPNVLPQLLNGGLVRSPGLREEVSAQLLSGGSVLSPALLPELHPQRLSGGSTSSPSLLPRVAPQRLSGGSTREPELSLGLTLDVQLLADGLVRSPALLSLVAPQRLSGGSVSSPALLPVMAVQLLSGGSVLSPGLLPLVAPQRISGGVTIEPLLVGAGTVDAQRLSGGQVRAPALLAEVQIQLLSGGQVRAPALLPLIAPQLLSGGSVLEPGLATDVAVQLLSGGSVLLPTMPGSALAQLLSGGSVKLPAVSTFGVSVQRLSGGLVRLPLLSTATFLDVALLSGGQVHLPKLLIFLDGDFDEWLIPGAQRQWVVTDANRLWFIPGSQRIWIID